MAAPDRRSAFDRVVVVRFENRSFDNLLGRLYQPGGMASFDRAADRSAPLRSAS